MNFFGRTERSNSTAENTKLDQIVQGLVQEYEREIDAMIEKMDHLLKENEVQQMENEVVQRCLAKYDEEASVVIGRSVDTGDHTAERKMMLQQQLEKKKEKLFHAMEEQNTLLRVDLHRYLDIANKFAQDTESLLPMALEELQKRFVTLNELLDALAQESSTHGHHHYPDGHISFDKAVHGGLMKEIQNVFSRLESRNEELSRQLHRQRLQYYLDFLQSFESDTEANLLPMAPSKLSNHLETFNPLLEAKVMTHYKEGMNSFDSLVGGELGQQIDECFSRLKTINANLIARKVDELKEKIFQNFKDAVKNSIVTVAEEQGRELETAVPDFIPERDGVVANLLQQIEQLKVSLITAVSKG
jgi:hypothetical protein